MVLGTTNLLLLQLCHCSISIFLYNEYFDFYIFQFYTILFT
jgi:hypothetical protein